MIKVYVMQTCPDCRQVKSEAANDSRFDLTDIGEHVRNLKAFLTLRDKHPAFDKVKEKGNIGLPCFVMEDGSISFSWNKVKQSLENNPANTNAENPTRTSTNREDSADEESTTNKGLSCSIDGKGC